VEYNLSFSTPIVVQCGTITSGSLERIGLESSYYYGKASILSLLPLPEFDYSPQLAVDIAGVPFNSRQTDEQLVSDRLIGHPVAR